MRTIGSLLGILLALGAAYAQEQVIVLQRNWSSMPTFYRDCMEVKGDGSYRFEHSSVSMQEPESHQIHAGKFSEDEMKQLLAILGDPALESLTTPQLGAGGLTVGSDLDTFWVAIDRGNRPQLLFFDSTSSSGKKFASERLPSLYRTIAMKPLLNWYKLIGKRKDDIDKTAKPTCKFQVRYGH